MPWHRDRRHRPPVSAVRRSDLRPGPAVRCRLRHRGLPNRPDREKTASSALASRGSRKQTNTRLVSTSQRRATWLTEMPGTRACAPIMRVPTSDRARRFPRLATIPGRLAPVGRSARMLEARHPRLAARAHATLGAVNTLPDTRGRQGPGSAMPPTPDTRDPRHTGPSTRGTPDTRDPQHRGPSTRGTRNTRGPQYMRPEMHEGPLSRPRIAAARTAPDGQGAPKAEKAAAGSREQVVARFPVFRDTDSGLVQLREGGAVTDERSVGAGWAQRARHAGGGEPAAPRAKAAGGDAGRGPGPAHPRAGGGRPL